MTIKVPTNSNVMKSFGIAKAYYSAPAVNNYHRGYAGAFPNHMK